MSVKVRPYRNGGFEVDIAVALTNGEYYRHRTVKKTSRSVALRWGKERERHLLVHGLPAPKKAVPTLETFTPRFLEQYAKADRHKPSGVAAKETILRVHLIPVLGRLTLDAITDVEVQRLKGHLHEKAPKTVNNILTVLNTLLKTAKAWGVITQVPCTIRLVPASVPAMSCHDVGQYEHLVQASQTIDRTTALLVLLGGEAGLRCGEMIALEWQDVDLPNHRLCIERSSWNGEVTSTKGGRLRYVPMTARLHAALRQRRYVDRVVADPRPCNQLQGRRRRLDHARGVRVGHADRRNALGQHLKQLRLGQRHLGRVREHELNARRTQPRFVFTQDEAHVPRRNQYARRHPCPLILGQSCPRPMSSGPARPAAAAV